MGMGRREEGGGGGFACQHIRNQDGAHVHGRKVYVYLPKLGMGMWEEGGGEGGGGGKNHPTLEN